MELWRDDWTNCLGDGGEHAACSAVGVPQQATVFGHLPVLECERGMLTVVEHFRLKLLELKSIMVFGIVHLVSGGGFLA
jgi:hypothetical protein